MILNSWLLCLLLYKSQYKNSLYNLVTELSHPPEVQALGKSSRYTDIVLIDFTLFLLHLFWSMRNISK